MKTILALSVMLALAVSLPVLADTPPLSLFDGLPTPTHLRQVEDPDAFLNYHTRTFVQVASFQRQDGAAAVVNDLRQWGFEPVVYLYQSRHQTLYVTMVMVSKHQGNPLYFGLI